MAPLTEISNSKKKKKSVTIFKDVRKGALTLFTAALCSAINKKKRR